MMSIVTDPNSNAVKQAHALQNRFPLAALGQSAVTNRLQQLGINYSADIRPLFGNPVVIGSTAPTLNSSSSRTNFLIVWVTKDESKLKALLGKIPGLRQTGSHDGATLYGNGTSSAAAVDGATLVLAPTPAEVNSALDRHANGGGAGESTFSKDTKGLSQDSLVEMFGDLSGPLSQPRAAKARNVPWVAALRGYGAAISASGSGLTIQYHLDTDSGKVSASQLPFAPGSGAPSLDATAPVTTGIKDPTQIYNFIKAAEQQTSPTGYNRFLQRQAQLKAKTGVDLDQFIHLFTGNLIIGSDTRMTLGKVGVSDPATASSDLAKLMTSPQGLLSQGQSVAKLPGGIYAIKEARSTVNVGVIGNQFVVGRATPAQLHNFASASVTTAPGAQGTMAFRVALQQVLSLALKRPPAASQAILNQFGDITGWSRSSTSGLDGSATIAVK